MTCDFMSYLTACQSYQDDSWMVMKGYEQWNPIYDRKDFRLQRFSNPGPLGLRGKNWFPLKDA